MALNQESELVMPVMFKDTEGKEVGRLSVISRYFRKQDETMSQFQEQCKALSEADKDELAIGAAKELGYTIVSQ